MVTPIFNDPSEGGRRSCEKPTILSAFPHVHHRSDQMNATHRYPRPTRNLILDTQEAARNAMPTQSPDGFECNLNIKFDSIHDSLPARNHEVPNTIPDSPKEVALKSNVSKVNSQSSSEHTSKVEIHNLRVQREQSNKDDEKDPELAQVKREYIMASGYDVDGSIHGRMKNANGKDDDADAKPPKRPLSAYNLFFHLERQRILAMGGEIDLDPKQQYQHFSVHDVAAFAKQHRLEADLPKPKRKHRKTHGKISFTELARTIATRWKMMTSAQRAVFTGYFAVEMNRYKIALDVYNLCQERLHKGKGMVSVPGHHIYHQDRSKIPLSVEGHVRGMKPSDVVLDCVRSPSSCHPSFSSQQPRSHRSKFYSHFDSEIPSKVPSHYIHRGHEGRGMIAANSRREMMPMIGRVVPFYSIAYKQTYASSHDPIAPQIVSSAFSGNDSTTRQNAEYMKKENMKRLAGIRHENRFRDRFNDAPSIVGSGHLFSKDFGDVNKYSKRMADEELLLRDANIIEPSRQTSVESFTRFRRPGISNHHVAMLDDDVMNIADQAYNFACTTLLPNNSAQYRDDKVIMSTRSYGKGDGSQTRSAESGQRTRQLQHRRRMIMTLEKGAEEAAQVTRRMHESQDSFSDCRFRPQSQWTIPSNPRAISRHTPLNEDNFMQNHSKNNINETRNCDRSQSKNLKDDEYLVNSDESDYFGQSIERDESYDDMPLDFDFQEHDWRF